jgi:hypothetical protein
LSSQTSNPISWTPASLDVWWILDSLKPCPRKISEYELSQFIKRTIERGYTVFSIRSIDVVKKSTKEYGKMLPVPDTSARNRGPRTQRFVVFSF